MKIVRYLGYAVVTILAMKAIIALFGDGGFWVETTILLVILLAFVLAGLIEERISQRDK